MSLLISARRRKDLAFNVTCDETRKAQLSTTSLDKRRVWAQKRVLPRRVKSNGSWPISRHVQSDVTDLISDPSFSLSLSLSLRTTPPPPSSAAQAPHFTILSGIVRFRDLLNQISHFSQSFLIDAASSSSSLVSSV
ncbi:hypothetical protein TorRG33x02_230350 [Trema orientale]|uniref:Uncharacterized protein n=1 Tax=Trema orientale TaxID=63057 RepID=A0A2P5E6I4_TREOI|nr:hypothetical protein TorRG33x02_230350 [Trema orientale]